MVTISGVYPAAIAALLPLSVLLVTSNRVEAFEFSRVYALGDSLSDTGNIFAATNGLFPPNTLYPSNGRFSNGPVWVEYLAPKLGTPLQSLAFGGARTDNTNTVPGFPGLTQQINSIAVADPNALYVLWAGANDYLNGSSQNPVPPVTNLTNAVLALAGKGAKTFAVANLPNLGSLPGTRDNPGTATALNQLTQAHNSLLAQSLQNLQQTQPGIAVYSLDFNFVVSDVITNPDQYGFTNVTDSCLLTNCATPDTYLFWDEIHPTTAAHAEIADFAFTSLQAQAVPEPPATLGLILGGGALFGLNALRRKQRSSFKISDVKPLSGQDKVLR